MFHFSLRQGFPSVQFSHSVMSDSATHGLQHNKLARWCSGKESACRCRRCKRHEFSPWVGKMPWRMAWGPTQYSCLENPMDRGAWMAAIHGVAKSEHTHRHTFTHTFYAASGHLDPPIPGLSKDTGPISDLIASHSCQPASSQRPCHHTPSKHTTHLSPRQETITEHIKKASARQAGSSLLFPVIFVLNHLVLRSGLPAGHCVLSFFCLSDPPSSFDLLPFIPGGRFVRSTSTCDLTLWFPIGLVSGELHQDTKGQRKKSGRFFLWLPPHRVSLDWFSLRTGQPSA